MGDFFKSVGGVILAVALFVALVFGTSSLGYHIYKTYAPAYEQVRNDTFKNSQMYNDGMIRELFDLKREYTQAKTDEERDSLKGLAAHDFEVYPRDRLPPELQAFYDQVMN